MHNWQKHDICVQTLTYVTKRTVIVHTWNKRSSGGCGSRPHRLRAAKTDSIKLVLRDKLGRFVFSQWPMSNYNKTKQCLMYCTSSFNIMDIPTSKVEHKLQKCWTDALCDASNNSDSRQNEQQPRCFQYSLAGWWCNSCTCETFCSCL